MKNLQKKEGSITFVIGISLVATLGGLLFGYDTAVISGGIGFLQKFFLLDGAMTGWAAGSAIAGCILGAVIAGGLSDKFGRKKVLIFAAVMFLVSAIGSAIPKTLTEFIIYRIIGGIGVGAASMTSPLYIAEVSPAKIRGRLVSLNQFAIIFGMLIVYFVNYGISLQGDDNWLNTVGWRWMFASETIPALTFLMFLFFAPESTRWLILNKKEQQGFSLLERINGKEKALKIFDEIKDSVSHHVSAKLFSYGVLIIVTGILLSVFQQFVGINVVLYYAPEIFKNMGSGTDTALLQTIIVGIINLSFTVVAIKTVDNYGRKPLQIIGALGMSLSMFALGFAFYFENVGTMALIFMLTYVAAFALSWGPVTWVLLAEIFPNKIRGKALAVAVAAQWIANYLVSWSFPMMNGSSYLNDNFHHGFAYWVYGVMGILAALFVWKKVPETKGKSLEEIEKLW
jgi:SP family xylose:H+ symportor-like MFS transporter